MLKSVPPNQSSTQWEGAFEREARARLKRSKYTKQRTTTGSCGSDLNSKTNHLPRSDNAASHWFICPCCAAVNDHFSPTCPTQAKGSAAIPKATITHTKQLINAAPISQTVKTNLLRMTDNLVNKLNSWLSRTRTKHKYISPHNSLDNNTKSLHSHCITLDKEPNFNPLAKPFYPTIIATRTTLAQKHIKSKNNMFNSKARAFTPHSNVTEHIHKNDPNDTLPLDSPRYPFSKNGHLPIPKEPNTKQFKQPTITSDQLLTHNKLTTNTWPAKPYLKECMKKALPCPSPHRHHTFSTAGLTLTLTIKLIEIFAKHYPKIYGKTLTGKRSRQISYHRIFRVQTMWKR